MTSDGAHVADPGWSPALRSAWRFAIPFMAMASTRGRNNPAAGSGITAVRSTFIVFTVAQPLIGLAVGVLAIAADLEEITDPIATTLIAAAAEGALVAVGFHFSNRPLDCSDPKTLAISYTSRRFFVVLAFANAAALAGFTAFILCANPLPYIVGVALAAPLYRRSAPTRTRFALTQDELERVGCRLDLASAINAYGLTQK